MGGMDESSCFSRESTVKEKGLADCDAELKGSLWVLRIEGGLKPLELGLGLGIIWGHYGQRTPETRRVPGVVLKESVSGKI